MVTEKKCCVKCGSDQIVKNGSNRVGNRKYKCKSCGFGGVFESRRKSEEFKEMVVRAAQERTSSRGLARTFGIGHTTALKWIKKKQNNSQDIVSTLLPFHKREVLELDELWSFSKCDDMHALYLKLFVYNYNMGCVNKIMH